MRFILTALMFALLLMTGSYYAVTHALGNEQIVVEWYIVASALSGLAAAVLAVIVLTVICKRADYADIQAREHRNAAAAQLATVAFRVSDLREVD